MQREIRDIINELEINIYVVKQQEQALEILGNQSKDSPQKNAFEKRAKALICEPGAHIRELEELKRSAESTAQYGILHSSFWTRYYWSINY
jgi:hypothetical protein